MGQKVDPRLMRVALNIHSRKHNDPLVQFGYRGYNFYAKSNKEHATKFVTAAKIDQFITKTYDKFGISKVFVNFVQNTATVDIFSNNVSALIGKNGSEIEVMQKKILEVAKNDKDITSVSLNLHEVKKSLLDAKLVADELCKEIESKRGNANIKKMADSIMKSGAMGVKIRIAGRISGAEIARDEKVSRGRINATTLKANVSYAKKDAKTSYGIIGVRVYINLGTGS